MHPTSHKIIASFIALCKFLSAKKWAFWGLIVTNILFGIAISLLFAPSIQGTPFAAIMQHLDILITIFIILFLLTLLVGILGRMEIMPLEHEMLQKYLKDVVHELLPSSLKGLPTSTTLILHAVSLTEIFIPLQLRANRPLMELPISEEERAQVRKSLEQGEKLSEDMQDILLWKEREWLRRVEEGDRIEIAAVWGKMVLEHPTAVIQGYPGMGKSTLIDRLALHMALRLLKQGDPTMAVQLEPICVPIIIRLNDYAVKLVEAEKHVRTLKLTEYVDTLTIHSSSQFLRLQLHAGKCLILFDGLDEVDSGTRVKVQDAIKLFIRETRTSTEHSAHFNRYLITSRVAGYDQNAFENYPHYIIAELTEEQIKTFLPRWSRATVRRTMFAALPTDELEEAINQEAAQLDQKLQEEIALHEGVRKLAQYPLLLTLLAVMQHNKIELPKQRVRLYSTVSRTLLESRNAIRGLPTIPEDDVVQRLGPIALRMQEANSKFIRESDAIAEICKVILIKGGSQEEIEREAREFLLRLRHRSGLFVQRSGDLLGFFHGTFQEYFAARALLAQIEHNPEQAIPELVERAKRPGAHWREPFLLAVAYQSMVNRTMASRIIEAFLTSSQVPTTLDNAILAADCLIESEPSAFHPELERQIAIELLAQYEEAQHTKRWKDCEQIEGTLYSWLLSIHTEAYRPPLLDVLTTTIRDTTQVSRQCAVLTLLTMIAQRLLRCAPIIPQTLAPSLQALALSTTWDASTLSSTTGSANFNVADLALATLSLLGASGPAGTSLASIRHYFEIHTGQLRLLARYSLESGILLTPTVVPLSENNYQQYQAAIDRWFSLNKGRSGEQAIAECIEIHQALLQYAEEACYPACSHLLIMLQKAEDKGAFSWRQGCQIWRTYLGEQLINGTYIDYRLCSLLWTVLLQDQEHYDVLVDLLITHYESNTPRLYQFSQRFISVAANHLRDLRDLRDLVDLGYFRDLREIRGIEYFRDLRYARGLLDARYIKEPGDLRYLRHFRGLDYVRDSRYLRNLKSLNVLLLTSQVASKASKLLQSNDAPEQKDALIILLGRVLQVQEAGITNVSIEQEVQEIVQLAIALLSQQSDTECQEIILEIVRSLPARTEKEIHFILHLAETMNTIQLQNACAIALRRARPTTGEGWNVLETASTSKEEIIRLAINETLKRKVHA